MDAVIEYYKQEYGMTEEQAREYLEKIGYHYNLDDGTYSNIQL
jgi:hypothetical protein